MRGKTSLLSVAVPVLLGMTVLVMGCSQGGDPTVMAERNFCPAASPSSNMADPLTNNQPPRAYYQDLDTSVDTGIDVSLYACDPDTGSSSGLAWLIETLPAFGTVSATAGSDPDAVITYTPNPGFLGTDIFRLQVYDGVFASNVSEIRPESNRPAISGGAL